MTASPLLASCFYSVLSRAKVKKITKFELT